MMQWQGPPINVIGLGTQGQLFQAAHHALIDSELIIGSERQLALLKLNQSETLYYPSPLENLEMLLKAHQGKHISLLCSGDPLFFGLGAWLSKKLPRKKLHFFPNVSSVQVAFSRLGKPWHEANILSLHGRPLTQLYSLLANQTYALLTDEQNTPQTIAKTLLEIGLQQSRIWVLENLDSANECVREFSCDQLAQFHEDFHRLNIVILETQGCLQRQEFPGFDDELFHRNKAKGGMISKRPCRLLALSLLATQANQICWDVGAGCGALAVEWAYWHRQAQIFAVEKQADRHEFLMANRQQFAVQNNLIAHCAEAPAILSELPSPHRIFVGGSGGQLAEILQTCWQALLPGGRMLISVITESSRSQSYAFCQGKDSQWHSLQSSTASAELLMLKPSIPVTLICVNK